MQQALPQTAAVIERGMAGKLQIGAQVYLSRQGQVVVDAAIGLSRAGVAMQTDTLMLWLSAGKPVSVVAVAQMWEQGRLKWDDPVARFIPEFAVNGKEAVTIRHILTHTCGFRAVIGMWEDQPWEARIAAICNARLEPGWVVGETAGYHPLTSWYVLGEIVRRLDGRPFEKYVRDAIFLPLGMNDTWMGIPIARQQAYGERWGLLHTTRQGEARANYSLDRPAVAEQCRPPSGTRGPIRELGKFYEALLSGGGKVLSSDAVRAITSPARVGKYDKTFKHVVDWGLAFLLQSNKYGVDSVPYGYGPHASERTFGHSGSRSSIGYADPEHGLVVACVFNGAPDEIDHDRRMREFNAAIYEDLGLAQ